MVQSKTVLAMGGVFAATGVALGAFAAHGLKKVLSPYLIEVFNTAVLYQMLHAIALVLCGLLLLIKLPTKAEKYFALAAICFIIGILCFSGSLYALALTGIKWFGPITPLGGVTFMLGWGLFVYAALQVKEVKQ